MKARGWVYVISNPLFPDLVKVGFSMKDPHLRATEGFDPAGLPNNFIVNYMAFVEDPRTVEQLCHSSLCDYHYNKEWFRVSAPQAAEAIVKVVEGRGSRIYFETDRQPTAVGNTNQVCQRPMDQKQTTPQKSLPRLKFVSDYLGWNPMQKTWVLKAVPKLDGATWVLEVSERWQADQISRTWIAHSVEELKDYCRQNALEFESFSLGKMNPILGQPKTAQKNKL